MQFNLNPIEQHKSQIQKRINLLEEKFKEKEGPSHYGKSVRNYHQDQNRGPGHVVRGGRMGEVRTAKVVEGRGRIKPQAQSGRIHKEAVQRDPLSETGNIKNVGNQKSSSNTDRQNKDEKMKELYSMMRQILEGQKNIEKEITQLKHDKQESTGRVEPAYSLPKENKTPFQSSLEKEVICRNKINQKMGRSDLHSINQSILIKEKTSLGQQPRARQRKGRKCKDFELEGQMGGLRHRSKEVQRMKAGEECKAKVWRQVQERVRQSEKEYKDTIHRNNKHEYDHLVSTFQLQRKLKDDLLDKVYEQCNKLIYK